MSGMKNVDLLSFQDFTHESSNSNENRSGTAARIDVESVHGSSGYTQPTSYETNINIERDEPLDQENKDTNHNFWSIKYYQKYFDVQTGDVIERIISSVVPHKVSSSFFDDSIRCKPDLYGPMWISITLILTIGVSGNISNYLQNTNKNIHWRYDFHLLSYAATAIFCYVWIVPLALWAALKFTSAEEDSEQIVDEKNKGGLDMLASAMPTTMGSASIHGGYSASGNVSIPGLESAAPTPTPGLPNLNIDDLFAKLVASGIVKPTNNDLSSSETPKVPETKKQEEDKSVIKHVNLLKSETMRQRQPGVVAKLYGGMQCSGCGTRFPPEHTVRYSQHLDWHFRQNRRDRDSARRAHSRNWHYDLSDWVQYEEIEDLEEREKSWFENQSIEEGAPTSGIAVTEHAESTVPASLAPSDQKCGVCGDLFDQYYDQDREEWHLRKAIRHNETNYHPSCYEDLKGSLQQEESKNEPSIDEDDEKLNEEPPKRTSILPETNEWSDSDVEFLDEPEDNIENIADSSNEVEKVPETKVDEEKQLEIEEDDEDDDDVVLKTEPVEEILVNDDDTDEETEELRRERDRNIPSPPDKPVRIKLEPVDPDDEPIITAEVEAINAPAHTTQTAVTSSLDGNVQLPAPTMSLPQGSHIRINITKPVHSPPTQTPSNNQQPPPPGEEEPELEPVFTYKESMQGKHFLKQPPVKIGNELSGLCSIM